MFFHFAVLRLILCMQIQEVGEPSLQSIDKQASVMYIFSVNKQTKNNQYSFIALLCKYEYFRRCKNFRFSIFISRKSEIEVSLE
jgi:hypothetical protein